MLPLLIVGGILLALAALLLAPVRLELSFREAFSAQVRYLFFRIPLAPGKEEEPPRPKRRPRRGSASQGPRPGEEAPRHAAPGGPAGLFADTAGAGPGGGEGLQEPAEKAPPEPV